MDKKRVIKAGAITALLFLLYFKRNIGMGVITENGINDNIVKVVKTLGGGLNAALLLAETCAVESSYGSNYLNGDVGIMQFTTAGFNDTKSRTSFNNKQLILARFNIDIDSVNLSDLQFSPLKSIIFARLFYLLRAGAIPATVENRAAYWKKYYNSSLGAGTVDGYIKAANRYKEQIDKLRKEF